MSRYKVLPLPLEFTDDFAEFAYEDPWNRPNKIPPVFNRPGLYLDRAIKTCWVETTHGCWILGGPEKFEQELGYRSRDEQLLHPDVIEAFRTLESHGHLPKSLRKKWWEHNYAVQLRNTYREASKWRLSIQKESS